MSLFANQREANLASTVALVEQALADLGHAPSTSRRADPGAAHAWRIVTGSATTDVAVIERSEFSHLRVSDAQLDASG